MLGEVGLLSAVPQNALLAALGAVVALAAIWALARRRPAEAPRRAHAPAGDLGGSRADVAALRQELEAVQRKLQANERLLVSIPDCTKELVTFGLEAASIPNVSTRQVKLLLGPEQVAFFTFDAASEVLHLVSGAGLPGSLELGLTVRLGRGKVGLAGQQRTLVDDAKYRYDRQHVADSGNASGLVVDLAAPMVFGGELLGVIAIRGSRLPSDSQRWLLQMVAELTAVAIHTARTRVSVEAQATTDGLTGLHNRKYLATRLPEELRRAESYGAPLSVILFDVDNFKHYNDRNGHPAGDVCLREVAQITRSVVRGAHAVVRYGGEEFLVLAPGTTLDDAMAEAERIRQAIAAAEIEHREAQPLGCVSVSIGVATFPAHGRTGDALVKAADAALYASKQAGRNRVKAASSGFLTDDTEVVVKGAGRA